MLTEDTARSIGMSSYFPHVRRVFVDILRALDVHYGRPLMMTSTQNVNKVSALSYKFMNLLFILVHYQGNLRGFTLPFLFLGTR
jgi:hypothetical protein